MEVQTAGDNLYYIVLIGTSGGLLLALSLILFYVRYQRRFIGQQAAMQQAALEHKQTLLNAVIQSQEEERLRISRELHDHVGSSLAAVRLWLAKAPTEGNTAVADARAGIDRVLEDVRHISHRLSPAGLELWGFHEALEAYCAATAKATGLAITITDDTNHALDKLSFDHALSLLRVVQELVNNTVKHAGASAITIALAQEENSFSLHYTDNGKGLGDATHKAGIGMYNIESRLSTLDARYLVESPQGGGYALRINIPATAIETT